MVRLDGLLLLVLVGLPAPVRAEAPGPSGSRVLPLPLGKGSHAGFLGPTAFTDDLAGHLRGTLFLSSLAVPEGEKGPPPLLLGWNLGMSVSLWRWAEAGAAVSGLWELDPRRHLAGPVDLWLRAGPPELGGWLALSGFVEHAAARPPLDGGGRLWPNVTTLGIIAGVQKGPLELVVSGAYQGARDDGEGHYDGVQLHAGFWLSFTRSDPWAFQIGGEALSRIGGEESTGGKLSSTLTFAVGVRLIDNYGVAAAFAYGRGWGGGLPAHVGYARAGYSIGKRYEKPPPAPPAGPDQVVGTVLWLFGYRDPLIGADGSIWSDDGKRILYRFGVRDPYHPNQIIPFKGGRSVAVGEHVLVRDSDGAVRMFSGELLGFALHLDSKRTVEQAIKTNRERAEQARARAAACPWCRPSPLPDYGPPNAGYAASCTLLRWIDCGIKPWDLEALARIPAPTSGVRGLWRAAAVRPPAPRWSFERPGPWPHQQTQQQHPASARAQVGPGPYVNLPPPRAVEPGKKPTPMQVREMHQANAERNGGQLRDDYTGAPLVPAEQSRRGVTPPPNEAAIDHVVPRAAGGDNSYRNLRVTSRAYNTEKGARPPTKQERR